MIYVGIIFATFMPLAVYVAVGLAKKSKAQTIEEYFIYGQRVSVQDYANTSVGYALQMAAMFLFAYWGALYGLGALWVPVFWGLGFLLLYFLLPKFMPFHGEKTPATMHQYLAQCYGGSRLLQRTAAIATILGLWGTMMAEIDYVLQVYSPVVTNPIVLYALGTVFLSFGVLYIIINGYKAEVNTERVQVPLAYLGLIAVLLLTLPAVWRHGGEKPYSVIFYLLLLTFVIIFIAKLLQGWSWRHPLRDKQILIPIVAFAGALLLDHWLKAQPAYFPAGAQPTILGKPIGDQLRAQDWFALFSLFLANVLWMPVDLSTWQRVASIEGQSEEVLRRLRKGTLRVTLESPATWLLGVCLGLVINGGGFIPAGTDPSEGLVKFSSALFNGSAAPHLRSGALWLYPIFIVACISIMLSTVDSLISAIAFTAHRDLRPSIQSRNLRSARLWTVGIMLAGLIVYPLLRLGLGADLPTFLYASYSAQLSLIVIVMFALFKTRISKRAALGSLFGGLLSTAVTFLLALRIPSNPSVAVLPPVFAVFGSFVGYVLAYREEPSGDIKGN